MCRMRFQFLSYEIEIVSTLYIIFNKPKRSLYIEATTSWKKYIGMHYAGAAMQECSPTCHIATPEENYDEPFVLCLLMEAF